jgi:L,D-transpeptidase-like protein
MAKLTVQLNPDRTQGGMLSIFDQNGIQVGYGLSVLGKAAFDDANAHGNPTADPTLPYGDTPTGTYNILSVTGCVPPYDNTHSYGPNGVIRLDPQSGQATTGKANGRTGILIHGGDLGVGGALRRTNGCMRLRDDEMEYLLQQMTLLSPLDPVSTIEVAEMGGPSIFPCDTNSTCGEGDPPPGF